MNLNDWAKEIHENAVAHGWWEQERELPEVLMLCVSELSEALEEYRDGCRANYLICSSSGDPCCECDNPQTCPYRGNKPEGIAVEMADCIIRILDYAGRMGWDMDAIIRQKHEYNKLRPWKHGGKVV